MNENRANAVHKAVRTGLQAVVAYTPMLLLFLSGVLGAASAATIAVALTPFVTLAHNLLEDRGVIGTWLRRPTPATPEAIVRATQPGS